MIDVSRDGAVATVRLDHGPVNVCDLEMFEGIADTFADLDGDDDVHAIVLAGNGRAFSAGVDLKRLLDGGEAYTREFLGALDRGLIAPLRTTAPVVAAVTGHAVAGGAVLAAACDHAVMTDDAEGAHRPGRAGRRRALPDRPARDHATPARPEAARGRVAGRAGGPRCVR